MTGEQENPKVLEAARWIAGPHSDEEGRLIPAVRSRFSLTAAEAGRACALASQFRAAARGNP